MNIGWFAALTLLLAVATALAGALAPELARADLLFAAAFAVAMRRADAPLFPFLWCGLLRDLLGCRFGASLLLYLLAGLALLPVRPRLAADGAGRALWLALALLLIAWLRPALESGRPGALAEAGAFSAAALSSALAFLLSPLAAAAVRPAAAGGR